LGATEFDKFADEYYERHAQNIAISGERPEYFAEYKVVDAERVCRSQRLSVMRVLDFGPGIGNSVPWFRRYFRGAELTCADISERSLEISQHRFPGQEKYVVVKENRFPLADRTFDLAFTSCVFHHISGNEHRRWLEELLRVTRPGGLLVVFEHNPWNPLTTRAVRTCPFDVNAELVSARALRSSIRAAGWIVRETAYRIFFPRGLSALRPLERYLQKVPVGAQYRIVSQRPFD
jgi:SAM-dependent methyltransferase